MTKVLDGWRTKYDWERSSGDKSLDLLLDSVTSHEGWHCPYCAHKMTVQEEEFTNQQYFELIHDSYGEPMKMECGSCSKPYFLKGHMTLKYSTCEDKDFGDE